MFFLSQHFGPRLLRIPLGLTIFVLYFDSVSQMSLPGP
jgi:hypothetical protein